MQSIIFLHGALGIAGELQTLAQALGKNYTVHNINFSGHGGEPLTTEIFSIQFFAQQVLSYMQQNNIEKTNIFGYSLGGYVGAYLAKCHPGKIEKLVTFATKFYWDELTSTKEVKKLNPETIQQKAAAYANELAEKHAPADWKKLVIMVAEFLTQLGNSNTLNAEDYKSVITPCLLLLGDRDKMVTLDETLNVYKNLPNARLGILPNTPHQFSQSDNDLLAYLIHHFINS